ncbi:hypothetical protein OH807_30410 [Kitasatospora sp. NBC_01560]|uniref:hypothetical protein n=1 Tax=Kitasatospora sp. NBC_01560 TaxID=2975965 RepID=UPI003863531A
MAESQDQRNTPAPSELKPLVSKRRLRRYVRLAGLYALRGAATAAGTAIVTVPIWWLQQR